MCTASTAADLADVWRAAAGRPIAPFLQDTMLTDMLSEVGALGVRVGTDAAAERQREQSLIQRVVLLRLRSGCVVHRCVVADCIRVVVVIAGYQLLRPHQRRCARTIVLQLILTCSQPTTLPALHHSLPAANQQHYLHTITHYLHSITHYLQPTNNTTCTPSLTTCSQPTTLPALHHSLPALHHSLPAANQQHYLHSITHYLQPTNNTTCTPSLTTWRQPTTLPALHHSLPAANQQHYLHSITHYLHSITNWTNLQNILQSSYDNAKVMIHLRQMIKKIAKHHKKNARLFSGMIHSHNC